MAAQARLDVKVTGDASGALKAIQSVRAAGNEAATKFREQSKEAIGAVVRSLNPIVLVGTAAASAIMGVGQKISEYFEEGREQVKKAGEELTKNAEAAGVTERAYQQLRTAAERAGVAQDEFNAKMQALKEGKKTVAALVEEWGKMPEKIGLTTDALERYQLEAAARRQKEEAEKEARDKNMSAVSREDELVGEFWARVDRGENVEAVANELIERAGSGWRGSGLKALNLKYRLESEWRAAEAERMEREWAVTKRQWAEKERQKAAAKAARRKAEADLIKQIGENDWKEIEAVGGYEQWALAYAGMMEHGDDYSKWNAEELRKSTAYKEGLKFVQELGRELGRSDPDETKRVIKGADVYAKGFADFKKAEEDYIKRVEAVGGIENFALARAAHYMNAGDDPTKWNLDALRASAFYRQEVSRYNATRGRIQDRKTSDEITSELAGKKRKADEEKRKADEEKRKADEAADKQREALKARRKELREWYKQAKAEAESYSGGYQNSFGLAFGGGDLIGAGRYRAVTRMTEAQKQLQVSEKLLEVNRQMNEKLKALEE